MLKSGTMRALGAMSGTSLDGVDVAVIDTDGHKISGFGETQYHPYSNHERAVLHGALGQWQDTVGDDVVALIEDAHVAAMTGFDGIDLVGFHGQTLAHDPAGRGTHQAGDGQRLANRLGLPVVWDFRSADVRLGGQGAPLAPFYHFALAKWIKADGPVAFLNLGGVGNLTWADPSKPTPESAGALLAFDTGPANAPINDLMQQRRGEPFDRDGRLAARGAVVTGALELFLDDPYFYKMPPKSLDRNAFDQMLDLVRELDDADAAATMTGMAASAVMRAMEHCPAAPGTLLVCGGGRKNPTMMAMLQAGVDCPVQPVEAVGLDGDMLEAQAFAYLAVRVAKGLPTSCSGTTGVRAAVGGGILSRPN